MIRGWSTLCVAMVLLGGFIARTPEAQAAITVDEHVRRAQILLSDVSPNGGAAAYIVARADPVRDVYQLSVRVVNLSRFAAPVVVAELDLTAADMFDAQGNLRLTSCGIHWLSDDVLLFTRKEGNGKASLGIWKRKDQSVQLLREGHDRIEIDAHDARLAIVTTDFVVTPASPRAVADRSLRMLDGYRFYGPLENPALGRWARKQRWLLPAAEPLMLQPDGEAQEDWELKAVEWQPTLPQATDSKQDDSEKVYRLYARPAPNRRWSVATEVAIVNANDPESSGRASGLALQDTATGMWRSLAPRTTSPAIARVIAWRADSKAVFCLVSGKQSSEINVVSLDGKLRTIVTTPSQLRTAGDGSRTVTRDARFAVLVRATNTVPDELVRIDLRSGAIATLDAPNADFSRQNDVAVRLIEIPIRGNPWGRLYLPKQSIAGTRYPLLFTQYNSSPGYDAAVGDEIPILPLASAGIAVFAMNSMSLGNNSATGDFRMEIARVQRPLDGMEWVAQHLVDEGIVDPDRIGLSGLSYGAEIATYAYWRSPLFRALSVASTGWDPSLMNLGGVAYGALLESRGLPHIGSANQDRWLALAAGPNARANLPPLLIQSGDREQPFTVPTWTQLRRAGAPVEWIEYPNEGHVKAGPAAKWWTHQRNLDWFRFWLQDYEDPAPAKAAQYARWHAMRHAPSM